MISTPYALLDFPNFIADLQFETEHYRTGHAGMEGNTVWVYIHFLWQTTAVISILAVLEILRGLARRVWPSLLLALFPVVYFVFISRFTVRNDRTILPLTPFLFLLAASLLTFLKTRLDRSGPGWRHAVLRAGVWALALIALIYPAAHTVSASIQLNRPDSRATARVWINEYLPSGSRIAIESYAPFIDTQKFSVVPFGRMIENPPDWYASQGFEYLVFSQGMFGRFFREPERYQAEVSRYEAFFTQLKLVKGFTDGGYDVRVYRIGTD